MKKVYIAAIILAAVAIGEGCVKLRVSDSAVVTKVRYVNDHLARLFI